MQIAAPAGSEQEIRRFFGELLGMEEVEKPELLKPRGGCWFRAGSAELHVGIEEPFSPAKKAHPAFAVTDIDALHNTLVSKGIQCRWDTDIPNLRRFYISDPFGNRIELQQDRA